MNLGDELRHQIQSYVARAIDADTLFGWLASVAHEAPECSDGFVREVWGVALLLLSELSSSHLNEDEVRHRLTELVSRQATSGARLAPVKIVTGSWAPVSEPTGAGLRATVSVREGYRAGARQSASSEEEYAPGARSYGGAQELIGSSQAPPPAA